MVEVRVRDEHARHLVDADADLGEDRLRRLPAGDPPHFGHLLAVRDVVVADVDHGRHAAAFDDDVAVGHFAVALVVRAVDEETRRLLRDVGVLHNPQRVAVHRGESYLSPIAFVR